MSPRNTGHGSPTAKRTVGEFETQRARGGAFDGPNRQALALSAVMLPVAGFVVWLVAGWSR